MFQIKTMNKISPVGLAEFGSNYEVSDNFENPDGILVRSAAMHDFQFPANVLAVARAGAGTNNIPLDRCAESGIVVFNTPGANANAVKELVIAALINASRDVMGGHRWVREQAEAGADVAAVVEKGKSAFVGPEIAGKTLGIAGLGAIGKKVAEVAIFLGMTVYGYDPFLSADVVAKFNKDIIYTDNMDDLYANCDYITLHIPYNKDTANTICAETIAKMKDGVRILNLARGELVNDDDMLAALESGKVARYVTDFPNNKITLGKNVVATPHLGASTPESEDNCAAMAAQELKDYLENGNIRCSVNLPSLMVERSGRIRICVIHRNVPAVLSSVTSVLSKEGINVENMSSNSRGNYAYAILDVSSAVSPAVIQELTTLPNVIRIRVI